jgi:glycosyltransferase involved in cell wall biosynthesis
MAIGNEQMIRQILNNEKIDGLFFFTDPRFFGWLFNMSDEIKDRGIPMFYNTIWDCLPVPTFNKGMYDCCDFLGCISKLTYGVMQGLGLEHKAQYIPHAIDGNIFKPSSKDEVLALRKELLGNNSEKFVFFYNSRNAMRKNTSNVLVTFKALLDKVGQDKAFLLMKTDPNDQEGGNLTEVARMLNLLPSQISFIPNQVPTEQLIKFYNVADATVCHSSNEGFGLSCLESLYCGTPVIVTKTGGLQEQPIDEFGNIYGVIVEPNTNILRGSQQIPYIYDQHASDDRWLGAYEAMFNTTWEQRKEIGAKAAESVRRRYGMDSMVNSWDNALVKHIEQYRHHNQHRVKFSKV